MTDDQVASTDLKVIGRLHAEGLVPDLRRSG